MAISVGPLPILTRMINPLSCATELDEMHSFVGPEPIHLTPRFTALKENLTSGKESALTISWQRLLRDLPGEVNFVSSLGSQVVPVISFTDTSNSQQADRFLDDLRNRGVGIIRNVVPKETAVAWRRETEQYINQSSGTRPASANSPQPQDVFWSDAQVKARAHPHLLAAQRFVMSVWKSRDPSARVTTGFPITYADRLKAREGNHTGSAVYARVDGGSVERWEPDGYGRAGTYHDVFRGRWEDFDPWESSTRLGVTADLYHKAGACSIFRMFQGWLALDTIPSGPGSVQVCPLPRHATAYFLLRPFFSSSTTATPPQPDPNAPTNSNKTWTFTTAQNSILHGAIPSYAQEINPALHPHLDLPRSLIPVPQLEPGDYLVWHPDLIHTISSTSSSASPPLSTFSSNASTSTNPLSSPISYMYLPACPLTQTNALYLARQRKAFLLGLPGPDFFDGSGAGSRGESELAGRAGVREVGDAGGDDGLRAMGLLPWDEEEADSDAEREVLAMANGILFPDLYDML